MKSCIEGQVYDMYHCHRESEKEYRIIIIKYIVMFSMGDSGIEG
jgi:hypothetical protein